MQSCALTFVLHSVLRHLFVAVFTTLLTVKVAVAVAVAVVSRNCRTSTPKAAVAVDSNSTFKQSGSHD